MPGILSTNNPVVKVSGLWPSTLTTGLLVLLSPSFSYFRELIKSDFLRNPADLVLGFHESGS